MSERRRLKAGVEVEVFEDDSFVLRLDGEAHPFGDGGMSILNLTEPIPEKPAEPKVGDEVTAEWLDSEWDVGRHHVVRNPDGSAASWDEEVDGTSAVEDADGTYAKSDSGDTWPLLALHPVKRWGEPEPTEPPLNKLKRTIETLSRVTDGHRRDMADDIQRLHHAVHVELEDRIEALEARTANILADMPWLNPNPKEVMPDAWDRDGSGTSDVAPPPGAQQDAPGGEEPSVEDVLGMINGARAIVGQLSRGERKWLMSIPARPKEDPDLIITEALLQSARIIRERGEEIERLRAEVASLTERLTITPAKLRAIALTIQGCWWKNRMAFLRRSLRDAGMIDPEVSDD